MGSHIRVPWKIQVRGSEHSGGRTWWKRRKFRDARNVHPTLLKEQDLDHLGALHDAAVRTGKD